MKSLESDVKAVAVAQVMIKEVLLGCEYCSVCAMFNQLNSKLRADRFDLLVEC